MKDRLERLAAQLEALERAQAIARAEPDPERREQHLALVDRAIAAAREEHKELSEEYERRPKLRIIPGGLVALPGIAAAAAWARRQPAAAVAAGVVVLTAATAFAAGIVGFGEEDRKPRQAQPPLAVESTDPGPKPAPSGPASPKPQERAEPQPTAAPPASPTPSRSKAPGTSRPQQPSPSPTRSTTPTPAPSPEVVCLDLDLPILPILPIDLGLCI